MQNLAINHLSSTYAVAPALKYRNVNIVTPSPGEVKGLIEYQDLMISKKEKISFCKMQKMLWKNIKNIRGHKIFIIDFSPMMK